MVPWTQAPHDSRFETDCVMETSNKTFINIHFNSVSSTNQRFADRKSLFRTYGLFSLYNTAYVRTCSDSEENAFDILMQWHVLSPLNRKAVSGVLSLSRVVRPPPPSVITVGRIIYMFGIQEFNCHASVPRENEHHSSENKDLSNVCKTQNANIIEKLSNDIDFVSVIYAD
jgi:hypothetical protein